MSHAPFALVNATVNRGLGLVLRSPLHGVASRRLLLRVRLRGVERAGHAVARGDETSGVSVDVRLEDASR